MIKTLFRAFSNLGQKRLCSPPPLRIGHNAGEKALRLSVTVGEGLFLRLGIGSIRFLFFLRRGGLLLLIGGP